MKWYIHLNGHVLCKPGTTEPVPFDTKEDCQAYLDEHCTSGDLKDEIYEFVCAPSAEVFLKYVRRETENN